MEQLEEPKEEPTSEQESEDTLIVTEELKQYLKDRAVALRDTEKRIMGELETFKSSIIQRIGKLDNTLTDLEQQSKDWENEMYETLSQHLDYMKSDLDDLEEKYQDFLSSYIEKRQAKGAQRVLAEASQLISQGISKVATVKGELESAKLRLKELLQKIREGL